MRLLPSLRGRKRYLAFRMLPGGTDTISRRDLTFELDRSSQSLLGDEGSSECDIRVLSFDGMEGIVSCVHTETARVRAVLATIYEIRNRRATVRVIGVSGTVKGAKRFFIEKR
ncbi:MAG: Rpp14/Pop5 family protein [Euryarchaeota archaeon]|nr:Rpp14/Pop5 family protein [Euryarchaeota archaeon]